MLLLERDAWSMVKLLRQEVNENDRGIPPCPWRGSGVDPTAACERRRSPPTTQPAPAKSGSRPRAPRPRQLATWWRREVTSTGKNEKEEIPQLERQQGVGGGVSYGGVCGGAEGGVLNLFVCW